MGKASDEWLPERSLDESAVLDAMADRMQRLPAPDTLVPSAVAAYATANVVGVPLLGWHNRFPQLTTLAAGLLLAVVLGAWLNGLPSDQKSQSLAANHRPVVAASLASIGRYSLTPPPKHTLSIGSASSLASLTSLSVAGIRSTRQPIPQQE